MRYQPFFIFLVATSITSQAHGKAAWEVSSRWLCRSTSMVDCREPGICERKVPTAINEVDFEAGTIRGFDATDAEVQRIAARQYLASKYGPGISFFSIAGGQGYAILDKPKDGLLDDGNSYPIQSTTIYGDSQTIHYGECRPRTVK